MDDEKFVKEMVSLELDQRELESTDWKIRGFWMKLLFSVAIINSGITVLIIFFYVIIIMWALLGGWY